MKLSLIVAASYLLVVPTAVFSQPQTVEFAPTAPESVDASAAYEQASAILNGTSAEKDLSKARQLFQTAADQGNPKAKGALGFMLAEGKGGPKDDSRALEYFSQAAAAGQREGIYNKGLFLLHGRGAPRDLDAALTSLNAAAAAGSTPAHIKLAELYYFGADGLKVDRALALPHVKAAAVAGDAWACNILGTMAEFGYAMPVDRNAALHWFSEAANKGNAKAQYNLGRLLRSGKPTPANTVSSYVWLKLASQQGETAAAYILKAHLLAMTPDQITEGDRAVKEFIRINPGKVLKKPPTPPVGGE